MRRTLVLWDIDGTLMHCGPVGAEVLVLAVAEVAGREPTGSVVMSGKTDRRILSELLELAGISDVQVDELLPAAQAAATRHLTGLAHSRLVGTWFDRSRRLARTPSVVACSAITARSASTACSACAASRPSRSGANHSDVAGVSNCSVDVGSEVVR